MDFKQQNNRFKKYTLKKLSIGVVSVGIGMGFVVPNDSIIVEAAAVETTEEEERLQEAMNENTEELEIAVETENTLKEAELEETAAETPEEENEEAPQEIPEGEGVPEEASPAVPVEETDAEEASTESAEEEEVDSEPSTEKTREEEPEAEEVTTETLEESEESLQESPEDEEKLEEDAESTVSAAIEEPASEEKAMETAEEGQTLAEPNDVAKVNTQIIEADAIANGYIKSGTDASNAVSTLSGGTWVVDQGTPSTMANGLTAVPEGTKVFLRWVDRDGAVSPIYSTVTHHHVDVNNDGDAAGSFAFDLRQPWVDANGKEHIYRAISGQYYKLWIQDYETEEGNTATMFRQAGGLFPGSFVNSVSYSNLGQFPLIGTNMQRTGIFMYIKPTEGYMTKPAEEHTEGTSTGALTGTGSIAGRLWLETGAGDYANSATGPNYNIADTSAEGYTVVFSSLTPEGAAAYKEVVERLDPSEQVNATKHLLEEHPEYIAATVYTVTDEDGRYQLTFPEGTYNHHYLYGYVSAPSGKVVNSYSSYTSPLFRRPNANLSFAPQTAPSPLVEAWFSVNFAVMPDTQVTLDIINYDSTANPASIGDTALLKINGSQLSPLNNRIVWTNSKGDVLLTYDHLTTITEADKSVFTVPEGTPDGEIFQATLYAEENAIASDSFIVHVPGEKSSEASNYEAHYEDIEVKQGEEEIIKSPTFTDSSGEIVQLSEGTRFRPGNFMPEWALINSDGSITVRPGEEVEEATYRIPVVVSYADGSSETVFAKVSVTSPLSEKYVPKVEIIDKNYGELTTKEEVINAVTIPDYPADKEQPVLIIPEGTNLPDGTASGEYKVPVKITYPDNSTEEVPVTIVVGNQPSSAIYVPEAELIEKDYGQPTTKKEIKDAVTIPGYSTDEEQPVLTISEGTDLPDGTKAGEYKVPVEITYPDGSTDEVTVTVTVKEQPLSDVYTPEVEFIEKKYGELTTEEDILDAITIPDYPADKEQPIFTVTANLPDGTQPREYEIPVEIIYPDGSTDEVIVTVVVKEQPLSDIYTPEADIINKNYGEMTSEDEVIAGVSIPGYPTEGQQPSFRISEGTDLPDGTEAGTYEIPVEVTYPDGSADEVTVTVVVGNQPSSAIYVPEAELIEKDYGESTIEEDIMNAVIIPGYPLDEDQPVLTIPDGTDLPDGTEAGEYEIPVEVVYPDGSTDEVTVIVVVSDQPYADIYTPKTEFIKKAYGEPTVGEEVLDAVTIPDYPEDERQPALTITAGLPDGTEVGTYEIPVKVVYPDGSTEEVTVTVVVGNQLFSNIYIPEAEQIEKNYGESTTKEEIIDAITIPDYQEGEEDPTFTITTDLPDGTVAGEYEVPVEVTYSDGSRDEVIVTVVVDDQPFSDIYTPEAERIEKKYGESTTKEEIIDAITIPDYPEGEEDPTFTITTDLPDGTVAGEYEVPVEVTYPDGSRDEVIVTVVVGDQPYTDIYTPEAENIEKNYGEPTTKEDIIETITVPGYPEGEDQPTFIVTTALPDGTEPGEYVVSVKVTYPDGSADEIQVTVVVGEPLASEPSDNTPKTEPIEKGEGEPIMEEEIIEAVTFPDYPVKGEQPDLTIPTDFPDPTEDGTYEIPVEITYPNGSTEETTGTVIVKNQSSANTDETDNIEEDVEKTTSMLPKTGVTSSLFSALTGLFMLGIGGGMLIKNNKNKRK
jgi:LPXTG-motif cell wall-anchored protein